jgi:membrane protease YdiL (CAAX protease family)
LTLGIEAALAPLMMLATIAFVRFVDRKPLFEIGVLWPPDVRHQAPVHLILAAVGSLGLLSLWTALVSLFVSFERREEAVIGTPPNTGFTQIALYALGFVAAACLTEWILRGYIFSALREQLSWVHASGVAALLFVLPSLASPDLRPAALANVFLLGLLLGALRELTGSVWPGVVFHAAWNTILGSILSLPVSGVLFPRLFDVALEGDEAWTGGDYGPEASWLMTFLLLVAVVALAGFLSRDELPPEKEEDDEDDDIGFF